MNTVSSFLKPIAEDLFRLTLPVPFEGLGTVHAYLIRGKTGWAIIDTGMHAEGALERWQAAWNTLGIADSDIERIILTHVHPDHFGLAGWIQDRARRAGAMGEVPVLASAHELELARVVFGRTWDDNRQAQLDLFFRQCGLPTECRALVERVMPGIIRATHPHPTVVRALAYGETLEIGQRCFRVIHTPGHSDGHIILYDANDGLVIAGDHILPHISPNIGRWPASEPNPLGRYLGSLRELRALDVRIALPGHGRLIEDWPRRIDELLVHHQKRLGVMCGVAKQGATVFDVTCAAFDLATLNPGEIRFAIAETLAHLEYLVHEGRLISSEDSVWHYRRLAA